MRRVMGVLTFFLLVNTLIFCSTNSNNKEKNMKETRIKMSFEKKEVIIKFFNNKTSKDFLSQLPKTLEFEDFAKAEKIAYLDRKLIIDKISSVKETSDFCYYAPWGNLAIFYKGYGTDSGLVKLGLIESGKENLIKIKDGDKVTLEIIK